MDHMAKAADTEGQSRTKTFILLNLCPKTKYEKRHRAKCNGGVLTEALWF